MERWLPIAGFDGYEVSDMGRVRSWRPNRKSKAWRTEPIVIKPIRNNNGYVRVCLSRGRDKGRTCALLHKLVLEAFVGPRPRGMQVRHVHNHDRTDCRLANLAWGTPSENAADKYIHGTQQVGRMVHSAKLSEDDVRRIRAMLAEGVPANRVAKVVGIDRGSIRRIADGTGWRHVS